MKKFIILLILSLLGISFKPSDNYFLYKEAILNHIKDLNGDTIYIIKCFDIEFPSMIGKYKIVDISDNLSSYVDSKNSLYAIKIMPIEIKEGVLEVTFIDYILKSNDGEVNMNNAGSMVYYFKYNEKLKKYKLTSKIKNTL